jgi:mRNA capping enzyme, beta chain
MDVPTRKLIVDKLSKTVEAIVANRQSMAHLEIEFRLGKFQMMGGRKVFVANINQDLYKKILKKVGTGIENGLVRRTTCTEDYFGKADARTTKDIITQQTTTVTKRRIKNVDIDLKNSPFDIRLSVSEEVPLDNRIVSADDAVRIRRKDRTSFLYRAFQFDLTEVVDVPVSNGGSHDKDDDQEAIFEIEVEIRDMEEAFSKPIKYSMEAGLLLCLDMIHMVKD